MFCCLLVCGHMFSRILCYWDANPSCGKSSRGVQHLFILCSLSQGWEAGFQEDYAKKKQQLKSNQATGFHEIWTMNETRRRLQFFLPFPEPFLIKTNIFAFTCRLYTRGVQSAARNIHSAFGTATQIIYAAGDPFLNNGIIFVDKLKWLENVQWYKTSYLSFSNLFFLSF